ncbi:MAG: peptidase M50 [Methanomicrobiales archaeon]|nr:peptidase M50 [Methanomicrobiales archaeon]MDI6876185.1 peptidase M50 [Methanomicrobiales archaeon]
MSILDRIPAHEWRDLLVAWIAISVAFTLIFVRGGVTPITFLVFFVVSLLTVGIGFVLHEMAHKFTAMHYGYWAEFRKDNSMLLIAIVMAALVGIVFAAPGATMIYGSTSRPQNGWISAAGPLTNLALCIPFAAIAILSPPSGILWILGRVGLQVNAMIATFNMLPVSILDGRKVLAWNPLVFGILIAVSLAVLFGSLAYL